MRVLLLCGAAILWLGCPEPVTGDPDGGTDAGFVEVDAGPFAYEARPPNPSCTAPAPPPGLSTVTTTRAFVNLAFAAPLGMFQAPGEPDRIIIMERDGRLKGFPNRPDAGMADVVPLLDISTRVNTAGEGGLLGLAFHPQWATKKELFLSYTETGNGPLRSIISRFKSNDSGRTFDPSSEEKLLQLDQPYANHNGGHIGFGPDGFLYIGFGDGGSGGDPQNRAQRLNTNHGKFLRIDVDVPFIEKYRIPSDNPYAADNTPCNRDTAVEAQAMNVRCSEIYALGLRNPWRWSFDTVSGELWAGDVGQGAREEVDRIVRGGNYGWKVREGFICYSPSTGCATAGFIDPVVDYPRADGNSITGGYVYRGTRIPQLVGRFVYGDYGSGRIWAVQPDAMGGFSGLLLRDTNFAIASFGQTLDGEVYVIDIATGQLHQLVPMGTPPADSFPKLLSATGCFEPGNPKQPVAAMIPYELNSPFWSDGALKERHFAIPDGTKITVGADGDFEFPNGTVISKTFTVAGKRVETRLFMRHADGTWAGYSYEWNDAETDAALLPASKSKQLAAQTWYYPSRAQCLQCHTAAAGRTLGPELAQLNRSLRYPVGATRNQLTVLEGLGFFTAPLAGPADTLVKLEAPFGEGALEPRARSWLHANCAGCHRAGAGQGPADFRFTRTFKETNTCNVSPDNGDLGVMNARLISPGAPMQSLVSRRIHALDAARMPPVGSSVVDTAGAALIDGWITSLTTCPP
jgi:uncharacterized repeat protein (TIGR03806 family)